MNKNIKLIESDKLKIAIQNVIKNNNGNPEVVLNNVDLHHFFTIENSAYVLLHEGIELGALVYAKGYNIYYCVIRDGDAEWFYVMAANEDDAVAKINSW